MRILAFNWFIDGPTIEGLLKEYRNPVEFCRNILSNWMDEIRMKFPAIIMVFIYLGASLTQDLLKEVPSIKLLDLIKYTNSEGEKATFQLITEIQTHCEDIGSSSCCGHQWGSTSLMVQLLKVCIKNIETLLSFVGTF